MLLCIVWVEKLFLVKGICYIRCNTHKNLCFYIIIRHLQTCYADQVLASTTNALNDLCSANVSSIQSFHPSKSEKESMFKVCKQVTWVLKIHYNFRFSIKQFPVDCQFLRSSMHFCSKCNDSTRHYVPWRLLAGYKYSDDHSEFWCGMFYVTLNALSQNFLKLFYPGFRKGLLL